MLRPLFLRTIKHKTGNDVLKLFEQFRKNLKLNKSNVDLSSEERNKKLKAIKIEIYDGLIKDLLNVKAFALCQIIYSEKMREKFEPSVQD
jgi:predicted nucleic acid-binding protein